MYTNELNQILNPQSKLWCVQQWIPWFYNVLCIYAFPNYVVIIINGMNCACEYLFIFPDLGTLFCQKLNLVKSILPTVIANVVSERTLIWYVTVPSQVQSVFSAIEQSMYRTVGNLFLWMGAKVYLYLLLDCLIAQNIWLQLLSFICAIEQST